MKGYPRGFPWVLFAVIGILAAAGLALIPNMLFFKLDWFEEPFLEGKTRMMIAAIHVSAAMAFAFLLGSIWAIHMRNGWRLKKHRISGGVLVISFVTLAVTGIGNFYLGDESWMKANGILHACAGIALILMTIIHPILGKRGR